MQSRLGAAAAAFTIIALAGCSDTTQSNLTLGNGSLTPSARSQAVLGGDQRARPLATEAVLYAFVGGSDGSHPDAGLTNVNGTLYGTTYSGGSAGCGGYGCGTVFSITISGTYSQLYSFAGGPTDGAVPESDLASHGGNLYGTTFSGGTYGDGTIFLITISGAERILYSFKGGSDGANPRASKLLNVGGVFYGTTYNGGNQDCGTVFSIDPKSGAYQQVYTFGSGADGKFPSGGLINANGTLYGTTAYGGTTNEGTVFKIAPTGTETLLYSFRGKHGRNPYGALTSVGAKLYGTTYAGGASGAGTVFNITTSGAQRVLYSFKGGSDGLGPQAGLTNVNGTLYGTTPYNGAHNAGTLFSITTSGIETVLYQFCSIAPSCSDGGGSAATLTNVGGTLYGTSFAGGTGNGGTVYSFSP